MPVTSSETPVGTPNELRVLGTTLSDWGSCAAPGSGNGRGCAEYHRCVFARPWGIEGFAPFRDQGPRIVGVLKVNNETKAARNDVTECFTYMRYMHDHNKGGDEAVMRFALVAQEGDTIDVYDTVPLDPNSNKTGVVKMKTEPKKVVIPPFPRPGMPNSKIEPQGVHAQATLQRYAARIEQTRNDEAITRSLAQRLPLPEAQMPAVPSLTDSSVFAAESPTEMVGATALPPAPIIPRRRGRPPKAR